jgi:hypothetical protein
MSIVKVDLGFLPDEVLAAAFEALLEQAQLIKGLAQIYVRVDTGSLRDSIRVERGGEGEHWRRVRVRAGGYIVNPTGKLVNYAGIVELRYPFMRPAFDEVRGSIIEIMKQKVIENIPRFKTGACFNWTFK